MRCPVARILGWTGLPAFLLRPARTLKSAPASTLASDRLLLVRESESSVVKDVEAMVSSRLCTPKELSSCIVGSESLDAFLPRCASLSMSLSLRRKKVVGAACTGLAEIGGAVTDFFPFNVRFGES